MSSLPQNAKDDNSNILGHTLDSLQVTYIANLLVTKYEGTYSREKDGGGCLIVCRLCDLNAALDLNGLAFSPFFIRYVDEIASSITGIVKFSGLLNKEIDSLFSISYSGGNGTLSNKCWTKIFISAIQLKNSIFS